MNSLSKGMYIRVNSDIILKWNDIRTSSDINKLDFIECTLNLLS